MAVLSHLEPKRVFELFEEMCAIPHGSRNTKAVSDWCVAFARKNGLEVHQDACNNVIIVKPATAGYENAPAVILQGHLDMVCQKDADCPLDMDREGLDLATEGDFIFARGTTLGSDNGIAVAMAMAALEDTGLAHPRLEAVFTSDEEIGLLGASALDVAPLKGRRMLNIDSEEEGVFTVSCAGGTTAACTLPVTRADFAGTALTLSVSGLLGGHSGTEIHKGRANASILLGRILCAAARATGLRIAAVNGGAKDNAIPSAAAAQVVVADEAAFRAVAAEMEKALQNEYSVTDAALRVEVSAGTGETPMDEDSTGRVITMLCCLPDGVQAMSPQIHGLVQTSLNLGILTTAADSVTASTSIRSSVDSQKDMLKDRLLCLMGQLGGSVDFSGTYAGWQYQENSPLRDLMCQVFRDQYGREPKVEAIHAGLECGIFAGKMPGLDCVSIGPDLFDVHTPKERMSISSVQRVWAFLTEVLRRSK